MHALRKLIKWFFIVLGVCFLLLLCALAYGWYAYDLGTYIGSQSATTTPAAKTQETKTDAHPILNTSQETMLKTVGIDPAVVPTPNTITEEQKACLLNVIGEARAREILSGSAPTFSELLSAKECL